MNIFVNAKDALKDNIEENKKRLLFIESSKQNDLLIIKIKDNAYGIDDKIIDKIFEPYFTTKHKFNGTGIGLYMSKLLVEKHLKGSLRATTVTFDYKEETYKGAEFTITLPLEI